MRIYRTITALSAALILTAAMEPVRAQTAGIPAEQMLPATELNLAFFEQQLAPFGRWISHPQFGEVWKPDLGPDFRPYFNGYWQFTSDYGWLWVSNEPFGEIVYHYGRWVYDPNDGWLWVPGYIWGPGWVAWRDTGEYVGWLPLPPGYSDYTTLQPNLPQPSAPEPLYGYENVYGGALSGDALASMWIFVPGRDFGRRDRRPYITDHNMVRNLYQHSKDSTHYIFDRDHDRILNRSLDKGALERAGRRKFDMPSAREFLHSRVPMTSVSQGQQLSIQNPPAQMDRHFTGPPERAGRLVESPRLMNPAGITAPAAGNAGQPQIRPPLIGRAHVFGMPALPQRLSNPAPPAGATPTNPHTEFRPALRPAAPLATAHVPAPAGQTAVPGALIPPAAVMPQAPLVGGAAHPFAGPRPQAVPHIRQTP